MPFNGCYYTWYVTAVNLDLIGMNITFLISSMCDHTLLYFLLFYYSKDYCILGFHNLLLSLVIWFIVDIGFYGLIFVMLLLIDY